MKIFLIIFAIMLASCVYDDPHQYFLRYQARQIGGSIDDEMIRRNIVDNTILSNGNGQVRYWYIRPKKSDEFRFNDGVCMEIYEYDRISRKILKTSFEGTRCVWNP